MDSTPFNIVVIGAGNLACQLAPAFQQAGHNILQILSPSAEKDSYAKNLALMLESELISEYDKLNLEADIIMLLIPDSEIRGAAKKLNSYQGLLSHSSGATELSALGERDNMAVFYPLQTFSKEQAISLKNVPIFIESKSKKDLTLLLDLADSIGAKSSELNSSDRAVLHLAAVFVSNFTVLMQLLAENILKNIDQDFDAMKPLLVETIFKVIQNGSYAAMTGPAARGDQATLDKHKELLTDKDSLLKIYELLSTEIQSQFSQSLTESEK